MKRLLTLLFFMGVVLIAQSSYAETKLSQPVIDLIKSNNFAIKFTIASEVDSPSFDKDAMKYAKVHDLRTVNTMVFDGSNALTITEGYGSYPELQAYGLPKQHQVSFATLYSNGESYAIMEKGKGTLYNASLEPNVKNMQQITHYVGSNNKQGKIAFEAAYRQLIYYLLPLLPEMNSSTDLQGNEVKLNNCTVFSKIGEANYGGQNYQFEEYKTPDGYIAPMVTRYYFKDGKLVKILQVGERKEIEADEETKKAFGSDKIQLGHLGVVEILEITNKYNPVCFQIPQGIKIMEFASPF